MSYNSYNTRNSGRYNTPGRFVSGGELAPGGPVSYGRSNRGHNNGTNNQYRQNQHQYQQQPQQPPQQEQEEMPIAEVPMPLPPQPMEEQNQTSQNTDTEMKVEISEPVKDSSDNNRPYWMRNKLTGVKKISNKERRRRQNENLRRLLAPKNALMVLNEMLPGEREVAQFKVEPAPPHPYYNAPNAHAFCAELNVDGVIYKGYGDNKIAARNDAAEQAIRDLIIKRMAKVHNVETTTPGTIPDADGQPNSEEEQALPMIQLASFALHKLFAEWECDGHKVPQLKALTLPQLKALTLPQGSDTSSEASAPIGPRRKPQRTLPANAATMHPCMLLTNMRPHLEYRELAVDGDRPQNMMFTMGIEVDGVTYIGKATNKREARKQAARAACSAIFGVTFVDAPSAGAGVKSTVA